jgi:hypothetical protein
MGVVRYIVLVVVFGIAIRETFAQDASPLPSMQPSAVKPVSGGFSRERLDAILVARDTLASDQQISWYETGFGYYGIYTSDGTWYMARYNAEFKYIETLVERDWSEGPIPKPLKSSINKALSEDEVVSAYWQSNRTGIRWYYLEMEDKKGGFSGTWIDESGQFSMTPPEDAGSMMAEVQNELPD